MYRTYKKNYNILYNAIVGGTSSTESESIKITNKTQIEILKDILQKKKKLYKRSNKIYIETIDLFLKTLKSDTSIEILSNTKNKTLVENYINRIENDTLTTNIYYDNIRKANLHKQLFSDIYINLSSYTTNLYLNYDTNAYEKLIKCYKCISDFNKNHDLELFKRNINSILKKSILVDKSSELETSSKLETLSQKYTQIGGSNKIFNYFQSNDDEIVITTDNIDDYCDKGNQEMMTEFDKLDIYTKILNDKRTEIETEQKQEEPREKRKKVEALPQEKEFVNTNVNSIFTINLIDKFANPGSNSNPQTYIQYLTLMYYEKFQKLLWYIIIQIINNNDNIKKFIIKQEKYLKTLHQFQKITIYTYTTGFYKIYNIWKSDKNIITNFKHTFNNDPLFVNCDNLYQAFVKDQTVFHYQIRIVLFNKIKSVISDYSKEDFDEDFEYKNKSIEHIKKILIDKYPNFMSEINALFPNNDLTINDYNTIFMLYGELLNEIIYNAPRINANEEFVAFRGSNNNYIKNQDNTESIGYYNNPRFSSYSINPSLIEEIVGYFYKLGHGNNDNRRLYEMKFTSEAIILFVAPVSKNPLELEIISAENSLINISDNTIKKIYKYNNSQFTIEEDEEIFKDKTDLLCYNDEDFKLKMNLLRISS